MLEELAGGIMSSVWRRDAGRRWGRERGAISLADADE